MRTESPGPYSLLVTHYFATLLVALFYHNSCQRQRFLHVAHNRVSGNNSQSSLFQPSALACVLGINYEDIEEVLIQAGHPCHRDLDAETAEQTIRRSLHWFPSDQGAHGHDRCGSCP